MTKQEAITKIESKEAKVLFARMSNGTPKVTVDWKDYLKIRNMSEVESGEIEVAIR